MCARCIVAYAASWPSRPGASPPARRTRRTIPRSCCGSSPRWPTRPPLVYQRYVTALSAAEREALWADYRLVGRQFGLRAGDMPATWDDFQAYMLDMVEGQDLHVTGEARDLAVQIVMRPPVPLRMRPALELANQITIGLLPPRLRRQYGFAWDPVRAVAVRGGAEYAKRFVVPLLPERLRLVRSARRAAA